VTDSRQAQVAALHRRVDVAIRGVRVDAPVSRRAGAGPSDDGHVVLEGLGAALPVNPRSPYLVRDGRLLLDGADYAAPQGVADMGLTDLGMAVEPVARPRFYDLVTSDGVPYEKLARLHGKDVLATTVVQTCMRYEESQRCRFCAIEASLESGATTRVKTPAQLAEVAAAAVELDAVRQVVLTTGTTASPDRGSRYLARCVEAILAAVPGIPVQVQCEPPDDLGAIGALADAGATAIGIHVESLDDGVRRRWMPGKASVPLARYWEAWTEAVARFGRNRVSTYLLVGLGEDPDELVDGARRLIALGVYPFVVPFRPLGGTLAADERAPDPAVLLDVTERVAAHLKDAEMRGRDQGAGCAACGACSALPEAGG
jgi:radical SAM protein (TIGR04043 family)